MIDIDLDWVFQVGEDVFVVYYVFGWVEQFDIYIVCLGCQIVEVVFGQVIVYGWCCYYYVAVGIVELVYEGIICREWNEIEMCVYIFREFGVIVGCEGQFLFYIDVVCCKVKWVFCCDMDGFWFKFGEVVDNIFVCVYGQLDFWVGG